MASGAPGSESHTPLTQSRGEHGPSLSCALPSPVSALGLACGPWGAEGEAEARRCAGGGR